MNVLPSTSIRIGHLARNLARNAKPAVTASSLPPPVKPVLDDPSKLLRLLDEELIVREMITADSRDTSVSVKATLKDANGDVLLLKDVRTGNWDLPGGHKQEGESDYQALVREIKEETGLDVASVAFVKQTPKAIFYDVLVTGVRPAVVLSNEHTDFKWEQPGRAKHDAAYWTGGYLVHDLTRDQAQISVTNAVRRIVALAETDVISGRDNPHYEDDAALIFIAALAAAYGVAVMKMDKEVRQVGQGDKTTRVEDRIFAHSRIDDLRGFIQDVKERLKDTARALPVEEENTVERARRVHAEGDAILDGAGKRVSETESQIIYGHSVLRALQRAGYTSAYWVTMGDERVRDSHNECEAAGAVPLGQPFPNGLLFPGDAEHGGPEEICNCFPADTLVQLPGLRAVTRQRYKGDLVELRFASGRCLSATPNHPILRGDGKWIPINLFNEGDDCISCEIGRELPSQPYKNTTPTKISKVYDLLNSMGVSKRKVASPMDLHGDATDTQIEVVSIKGSLSDHMGIPKNEQIIEFGFALANITKKRLFNEGGSETSFMPPFRSFGFNERMVGSSGDVGSLCVSSLLFRCPSIGEELIGFLASSQDDTNIHQSIANCPSADFEQLRQEIYTFPFSITLDKVVGIKRYFFHGEVFNCDTGAGYYTANGIATQNCRCWLEGASKR